MVFLMLPKLAVGITLDLVPTFIGGWNYAKTISKRL
jgi:hypothetical protein